MVKAGMRSVGYIGVIPVPSSAPILAPALAAPSSRDMAAAVPTLRDLIALTKPRLAFFSVLTAMAAYGEAETRAGAAEALAVLAGTSLAAGGALSLNQWWERDLDRLMLRTRRRPLPRAAVSPAFGLAWSLGLSVSGICLLAIAADILAAALAGATILVYGLIYTPLKRRTRWATEIGALSGALPPLLGAAAAGDPRDVPAAWILASILLLWQMPHFFAIGWMHRSEYHAAGFRLLPAVDPTGARTAGWSVAYSAALIPVSAAPWFLGCTDGVFGVPALAASVALLGFSLRFRYAPGERDPAARHLFLASIVHLPVVLAALLLDRVL